MTQTSLTPGKNVPHEINVVIEIPMHSHPVKYEMDKASNMLFVDRFIGTAMFYPTNYGYIPHTLSEGGDPVDVLVITPYPLINGAVIVCRPVGILHMSDESGVDAKILAVPIPKLTSLYDHIMCPQDLPAALLASIKHFFEHYKDLEVGKWVKITGWGDQVAAHQEIMNSIECIEF